MTETLSRPEFEPAGSNGLSLVATALRWVILKPGQQLEGKMAKEVLRQYWDAMAKPPEERAKERSPDEWQERGSRVASQLRGALKKANEARRQEGAKLGLRMGALIPRAQARKKAAWNEIEIFELDTRRDPHRVPLSELFPRGQKPESLRESVELTTKGPKKSGAVLLIHGLGLDGDDFREEMGDLAWQGFAPTIPGCEPGRQVERHVPSFNDICSLVQAFSRWTCDRPGVTKVAVVGFSTGADFLAWNPARDGWPDCVRGLVLLDPNVGPETAFFTGKLAALADGKGGTAEVSVLTDVLATSGSVDEWLLVNRYLGHVVGKFREDLSPLGRLAEDILKHTGGAERSPVSAFLKRVHRLQADGRIKVRVRFSDRPIHVQLLDTMRDHPIGKALLAGGDQAAIDIVEGATHFELKSARNLRRILAEVFGAGQAEAT